MRERGGQSDVLEVRCIIQDLPPVVDEEERRDDLRSHLGEQDMVEDGAERTCGCDHQYDGREQALHAPDVEVLEVDAPCARELHEQDLGDDVARDHEEHRHAHEATLASREPRMVGDHGKDG